MQTPGTDEIGAKQQTSSTGFLRINPNRCLRSWLVLAVLVGGIVGRGLAQDKSARDLDLQTLYPTKLTAGDTSPDRARTWEFSTRDIYSLSRFNFGIATNLQVETGPADLGIGHGGDGAVWALVIPRQDGKLTSPATGEAKAVAHIWLRFHPAQLSLLFPPETVTGPGTTNLAPLMRAVAAHKFRSSFHAGANARIPAPNDLVLDADTPDGTRRFFIVDKGTRAAVYVAAFESQGFKPHPALTRELAEKTFDQLWSAFDFGYAMFGLRPEVDWAAARDRFRPKALACQTSDEFAAVCAEMLKPLRDLHVSLRLAGTEVPVFDRPRTLNANPSAHKAILGNLKKSGQLQSAVTSDNIGFIGLYGFEDEAIPELFNQALEPMRQTRSLILDVRCNGGGNERLAQQVAGRFFTNEFVYAYNQFRDGPAYTNLTQKVARKIEPAGPWCYEHPVVLLIGQKCMSSCESFVGMMTGDAQVTTMGDHTCGSSGNPQVVELPLSMTVTLPQWIDYKPDGQPLDEHGFVPQVPFAPELGAFGPGRDDLLSAALARLRSSAHP